MKLVRTDFHLIGSNPILPNVAVDDIEWVSFVAMTMVRAELDRAHTVLVQFAAGDSIV